MEMHFLLQKKKKEKKKGILQLCLDYLFQKL